MDSTKPEIILIGLNHKTAPISLRECIAFSGDETLATLGALKKDPGIKEVLVYATCNRVEFLMVAAQQQIDP